MREKNKMRLPPASFTERSLFAWTRHAISSFSIKGFVFGEGFDPGSIIIQPQLVVSHTHLFNRIITGQHIILSLQQQVFPYARPFYDFSINIQAQPETIINWVMSLAGNDILLRICQRERSFRRERHPSARPCVWRNLNSFLN